MEAMVQAPIHIFRYESKCYNCSVWYDCTIRYCQQANATNERGVKNEASAKQTNEMVGAGTAHESVRTCAIVKTKQMVELA